MVFLEALPLTPNGKVDRRALPAPSGPRQEGKTDYVAPRTPVEELLTTIWSEVLGVKKIGVNDNFFDLGGHSLLALQVYAILKERTDRDLALVDLFSYPSIHALARYLDGTRPDDTDFAVVKARVDKQKEARLRSRRRFTQEKQDE